MNEKTFFTILVAVSGNSDRRKAIKIFFLAFFFCCINYAGFGQVSITPGSGGTSICSNKAVGGTAAAFTTLAPITIAENSVTDFAGGGAGPVTDVIVLNAPAGWQFSATLPAFGYSAFANVTGVSGIITSTTLTVNITVNNNTAGDQITISGLQIQATSAVAAPGYIYASSVTGVSGITTGTSGTNFGNLSLNPLVTPSVTIAATPGNSVCAGTNVVFTPTPTGGGASPAYSWSVNGTTVSSAATYSNSTLATGNTIVCTMTSSAGCIVPGAVNSNTITMTVNPVPAAITGTATVCPGTATKLSDPTSSGSWSSATTSVATIGATGIVTGVAAGTALISYTVAGCAATTSVTVNNIPVTPVLTPSTVAICNGNTITMTASGISTPPTVTSNDFNAALTPWTVDNTGSVGATSASAWKQCTDGFSNALGVYHSPDNTGFAMSNADASGSTSFTSSKLISPVFSLVGYASATLNFQHAYQAWPADTTAELDISTDGGSTWTRLRNYVGTDVGNKTSFVTESFPLTAYLGMSNLSVRFYYYSNWGYFWVLDNITITGTSSGVVPSWSPATYLFSDAACTAPYIAGTPSNTVYMHPATVTSATVVSYTATASNSGCTAVGTNTVTINASPGTFSGSTNICVALTSALSNSVSGGVWSSGSSVIATVTSGGGVVSGVSVGSANITYTLSGGCYTVTTVTVYPLPSAITGTKNVCAGSTTSLGATPAGGTWSSGNLPVATVVSGTGAVTGAATGISVITYNLGAGCISTASVTVNPVPSAISGPASVCSGSAITFSNAVSGGTWSSSNTSAATIVQATGVLTGVSVGGAISVIYSLSGNCAATLPVTVYPLPGIITGTKSVCKGLTTMLSDEVSGGIWSSDNTSVATVTPGTSTITGVAAGTANITYTIGTSCIAAASVTVNPLPSSISGSGIVCAGSSVYLSDITTGGTWGSSNTALATVDANGGVTGRAAGAPVITYTLGTGCVAVKPVTVNPLPASITGNSTVCIGMTTYLSDAAGGGTWSSSATSVATVVQGSGLVSGITAGTTSITYTLATGCLLTQSVTVNALPSAIFGLNKVCAGQAITLSNSVTGGTWSTGTPAFAGVIAATGVVTGIGAGIAAITYTLGTGCIATTTVQVNPLSPITGITNVCEGLSTILSDATGGGTWSSGNTALATVGAGTGMVRGIIAGTAIISYILPTGCTDTASIKVNPVPAAISGSANVCLTSTIILSDGGGGTWSSSNSSVATVGVNNGNVLGLSLGTVAITYSVSAGCIATTSVTVNPLPAAISGASDVCVASGIQLSDGTPGGTWSSGNTSFATVSAGGMVTGVAAGTATITYTLPTGCTSVKNITVDPLPSAITGITNVCVGLTTTLSDVTGGTWSSSNTAIATVNPASGVVSGVAAGTAMIFYGIGTGCAITTSLVVNPLPAAITGTPNVCMGLTTALSSSTSGGTWSSSNTSVATIAPSGIVSSVSTGIASIIYKLNTGCLTAQAVAVNPLPNAITGNTPVCVGSSAVLSDGGGGTWSSGNTGIATVVSSTGTVTGASGGTAIITYKLSTGCIATASVLVNPLPFVITGANSICFGFNTILSDVTPGGTWSSSNTSVATIVPSGPGVVTSVSSGVTAITYTLATGCVAIKTFTVNPLPNTISGNTSVCVGLTTALSDAGGGTWSSSNTSVATVVPGTGVVTGASAGTAIITYTLPTGCIATASLVVHPLPSAISGTAGICYGLTATLSNSVTGGTWSSSNTAAATINPVTGFISAVLPGTTTITYTLGTGCVTTKAVTVNPLPSAITGQSSICILGTATMSDATAAGTWSSSNTAVATIGSANGMITGIASGTVTITYKLTTGCMAARSMLVNALPPAITGSTGICLGATTALSDISAGGTWSSNNTAVAVVNINTGDVFGVSVGTAVITYTVDTGCTVTAPVAVNALPSSISGAGSVCAGLTAALSDGMSGGKWSSVSSGIATVGSVNGVVTGVAPGVANIIYTLPTGCSANKNITVNASPSAITGITGICLGSTTTLSNGVSGGTWSSNTTNIAIVSNPGVGVITGALPGNATVTYMLPGNCAVSIPVTVNTLPGGITGTNSVCTGLTISLTDGSSGGTWSSNNTSIATVSNTGIVGAVSGGTAVINYTLATGCAANKTITVNTSPSAITGPATICAGVPVVMSNTVAGGTWSSSNTLVATVDAAAGVVTGTSGGAATISYIMPGSCIAKVPVTVNPSPAGITGNTVTCIGLTTALSDAVTGGTWSSSNTSVATVSATGSVKGVAAGTAIITYKLAGGCFATIAVVIYSPPSVIAGSTNICLGSTSALSNTVSGGTWSSSNTVAALVGSATGIVTGLSPGSSTISYSIVSGCSVAVPVTVNSLPSAITGVTTVCIGATTHLSDAVAGGTWSSNNTSVATVVAATGVVAGVSSGTASVIYKLSTGCTASRNITVSPLPTTISGITNVCLGYTSALSNGTSGGTWTSSNTAAAAVDLTTGVVTGVNTGAATITYSLGAGCAATVPVSVISAPAVITGATNFCIGLSTFLSDATTGGVWSSSNTAVATVLPGSGHVTAVAPGTAVIAYSIGTGCAATVSVIVSQLPSAISGNTNTCIGAATALSNATGGGVWSSSNTSVAIIGTGTGIVTGLSAGTSNITYALGAGCTAAATITVGSLPSSITGTTLLCIGTTTNLSNTTPGGTWSSNNTSVATIDPGTGVVSGIAAGTAKIIYTSPAGCTANRNVTVSPLPSSVSGNTTVCLGAVTALSNMVAGGTWSSDNAAIAAAGSGTGMVTGVSTGVVNITYSLGAGCTVTTSLTVIPLPPMITGVKNVCPGSTTTLSNASGIGTWGSGNTAIATADPVSGIVTGIAAGNAVISYTAGTGCTITTSVIVDPLPSLITGAANVCVGSSAVLSDGGGGTWSTGSTAIATIGPSTGVLNGISTGTAIITYTLGTGCITTTSVSIIPLPLPIAGTANICSGASAVLSEAASGGTWSSSNTAIATIGLTTGIVTGAAAGNVTIFYKLGTGCAVSTTLAVNPLPPAITGVNTVCRGLTAILSDSGGGIWSSGTSAIASIGSSTGMVTGNAAGTSVITYMLGTGCMAVTTVTVNPLPSLITGVTEVCAGSAITLSDAIPGGTWSSDNTSVATVTSGSGVVSGITTGAATITYKLSTGCLTTTVVTVHGLPAAITGATAVCAGSAVTLSDVGGGTWSSSNTNIAVAGSSTGIVSGIAAGSVRITYTLATGCIATRSLTVNPLPLPITGITHVCAGSTTNLTDAAPGGAWSSNNTSVATINASGVLSGLSQGTAAITYTLATGCATTTLVTVNALPSAISGVTAVCEGAVTALSDAGGGTWGSSNTSVAKVNASGVVSGISAGVARITYSLSTGCLNTVSVTVDPLPSPITGVMSVCAGLTTNLTDAGGGTWSSGNTGIATVTGAGSVTGVGPGSVVITYRLATGCSATALVVVNPVPSAITGTTAVCAASSVALSEAISGGVWSSGNTGIATVVPATGVVSGVATGTANITYTLGGNCMTTTSVTVLTSPSAIAGFSHVCFGAATALSVSPVGGTWSSSNTTIAAIDPAGVVTGVAPGAAVISYSLGTGCTVTMPETVNPVLPITGTTIVCATQAISLTDALTGGTWSSSNTAIAVVNSSGMVTGISAGMVPVIYTLPTGCATAITVTVNPLSPIAGTNHVCIGSATQLNNAVSGGTWSSGNSAIAAINSSGVVTGVAIGTAVITYTLATGCAATFVISVNPIPMAITGNTDVCIGATTFLSDATPGGSWGNTAPFGILTIGVTTGAMTGLAAGTEVITYTAGGCIAVTTVMVHPPPSGISGASSICSGSATAYNTITTGGTWSTGNTSVATIAPLTGMLTAVSAGVAMITYSTGVGCMTTAVITVAPLPPPITGATDVCAGGATANVSDAVAGGTWTSTLVTVSPAGVVTGYTPGTAVITYTLPSGCSTSAVIFVDPLPAAITGPTDICLGAIAVLNDATPGGAWSTVNTSIATVGALDGRVSGLAAGVATIKYTLGTGCSAIALVTVHPLPPPITGNTTVCAASSTILNDGTGGGAWSSGATGIASAGAGTGIITGIAAGAADITYTLPTGCFVTTSVLVNPLPVGITGINQVCIGGTTALSDFPLGGTWSSANTSIAAVGLHSGMVTGVSVSVTTLTYTIGTGCLRTVPFTVNPLPPAITGPSHVCSGAAISLSNASVGGTWISGYSGIVSVGSATGMVTGGSAGTAVVTYSLITGCTATASVTVDPPPVVYTVTGGGSFCESDTGRHIGLAGSAAGFTYRLYRSSVFISMQAGTGAPLDFGLQTTSGTYMVTAENNITGCRVAMRGNGVITAVPVVTPSVSIVAGTPTICSGTMTAFNAVPVNGGTATTYQWKVNGTNVAAVNPYHYIPANGDVVSCTMTGNAPCATAITANASVTLTITPRQMPGVSITAMPGDTICAGTPVTYLPVPVFGGPAPAYTWKRNGVSVAAGSSYNYTPANGDSISCVMASDYPCLISDSAWSNGVVMSVAPVISPSVTITAAPGTSIGREQSDTLTAIVVNGDTSPTYQWYINGAPIPGATSAIYINGHFSNHDSVSCTVASSGLCGGLFASASVIISIYDLAVTHIAFIYGDIRLVPNPNKGEFRVSGVLATQAAGSDQEVLLEVTDMLGQVVYKNTVIAKNGKMDQRISLDYDLANGMYMLSLHTVNENRVFHFVVVQ